MRAMWVVGALGAMLPLLLAAVFIGGSVQDAEARGLHTREIRDCQSVWNEPRTAIVAPRCALTDVCVGGQVIAGEVEVGRWPRYVYYPDRVIVWRVGNVSFVWMEGNRRPLLVRNLEWLPADICILAA
jgi:hypothetical protein